MMVDRRFGDAGDRIVLEEFLVGQEASYFVLADGTNFVQLGSAQDHKRIFDDDRGPNTGGMGAFAPSPLITPEMSRRVCDEIVSPVLAGMEHEGHPYRGFLYVGLMLTADGPKVIEFNVRFGDPEAQVVLPMLDEDLAWLLGEAATGALPSRPARFRSEPHVGVVLAAGGYPDSPEIRQAHRRSRRRQRRARSDRLSRRHQQAGRPSRHRRRSRADRRRAKHDVSRRDRHGICRRVAHSLRWHAVPARHRTRKRCRCE